MLQSQIILSFYTHLKTPTGLPEGVGVLNPFSDEKVMSFNRLFYDKYYHDKLKRTYLIGINPGRFGAGVTGIPFTDPIRLQDVLEIDNNLDKKSELSSKFIFDLIDYIGNPELFFGSFYFTSVSPLGFVKNGKNLNYYDQRDLEEKLEPFMVDSMWKQINTIASNRDVAFCLGQGKNFKYFDKLNRKHGFFDRVQPLPHPRWVMQYRLKKKQDFIGLYGEKLHAYLNDF